MSHANVDIFCILTPSTCNKRQWNCTDNPCKGTCTVYGNGHYMSFDGEKFDFLGDCDYILAQVSIYFHFSIHMLFTVHTVGFSLGN